MLLATLGSGQAADTDEAKLAGAVHRTHPPGQRGACGKVENLLKDCMERMLVGDVPAIADVQAADNWAEATDANTVDSAAG